MTASDSCCGSKFGWQEGWVNDYNKIILLDRLQKFTNNKYSELNKGFKYYTKNTKKQLFEAI